MLHQDTITKKEKSFDNRVILKELSSHHIDFDSWERHQAHHRTFQLGSSIASHRQVLKMLLALCSSDFKSTPIG